MSFLSFYLKSLYTKSTKAVARNFFFVSQIQVFGYFDRSLHFGVGKGIFIAFLQRIKINELRITRIILMSSLLTRGSKAVDNTPNVSCSAPLRGSYKCVLITNRTRRQ